MKGLDSERFGDNDCVLYMLTGSKHAAHLIVSVHSLRKVYGGPILILAGCDESAKLALAVRFAFPDIYVARWQAAVGRANGSGTQYANKCEMHKIATENTDFERFVFVDADTIFAGVPNAMLPPKGFSQVRLTQMVDWTCDGRRIRKRIEPWRDVLPKEVTRAVAHNLPALNTGVIGFSRDSTKFMNGWRAATHKRISFICDEIAANLIFPDYSHMIMPDRWNASVVYSKPETKYGHAIIWHGHGQKFKKKGFGWSLWGPLYRECEQEDIAGIRYWATFDRHLQRRLSGKYDEGASDATTEERDG